jgi:L-threonylcarbamoyladenylate synthase
VDDAATLKACLEGISTDLRLGYLGWQAPPQRVAAAEILADEPKRAAQQLYAALRELDRAQLDRILIHAPPKGACWEGIRDRLKRAATPSHKKQVV